MNAPLNEAAQVARVLVAAGVDPRAHHETIKKVWRAHLPGWTGDQKGLLPRVRTEMQRIQDGERAATPPVEDLASPDWGIDHSQSEWERAKIEDARLRREAEEAQAREKAEAKQRRLAEFKEQKAEEKLARENARAVAAANKNNGTDNNESETKMSTATMKKSGKKSKKTNGTRKPKAAIGTHAEQLAAIQKKYPHVSKVVSWSDKGKAEKLEIVCPKLVAECEKRREIWVQDAFQVKTCETCKPQARKLAAIKRGKKAKKS